ncbi:D-arabinitol 4-dehydrogenase [Acidocella sp.]|uniref:D-arabinitol 4-dehydrogenase n=1 Tax=Acidocella sp. TaxID=50710 RepID=UPI0026094768|nr:D-arabinitol 4-dehydrogenase [Acidocella sp.]
MSDPSIILHLGIGSFHRAHQAVYLQQLHDLGERDWVLAGANIRPDMRAVEAALIEQGGAYHVETVTPAGERAYQEIRSIRHIVPWDEKLGGMIEFGARADVKIISFTVTEAGYYLTPQHALDLNFPDLVSDLTEGTMLTIYGALAAILHERARRDAGPVTLLSCDNLRSNGERFHGGFTEFLRRRQDEALLAWLDANTASPSSMVDRITPRPLPDVAERVRAACGGSDACPVMAEDFIQWVIEDEFAAGRPNWEKAGAELVVSVLPYEEAKIRLLNAAHALIAWAGTLGGYLFIHEGTQDEEIRAFSYEYVTDDVLPVLEPSPLDLRAYRDKVLERFSNANIRDTNQRVAADGYSKIPGWVTPTIRERLARNETIDGVAMIPALFFLFLQSWAAGGIPFVYQDQAMDEAAVRTMMQGPAPLAAFCQDAILWGDMAGDPRLEDAINRAHRRAVAWLKGR